MVPTGRASRADWRAPRADWRAARQSARDALPIGTILRA